MDSIRSLKGIGEKTEQLFLKLDIQTIEDLLQYYPRDYDIYKEAEKICSIEEGKKKAVKGRIKKVPALTRVKLLQLLTTSIEDDSGSLEIIWYNMPFLQKTLHVGTLCVLRGRIIKKKGKLMMEQPEIFSLGAYEEQLSKMQPIYGLTAGLSNKMISKAVAQALEHLSIRKEYLPENVRKQYSLAEYNFAIQNIHFPKDWESFVIARKRLVFEEFFIFILALRELKRVNQITKNAFVMKYDKETERLIAQLPYTLTNAQKKVWEEIQKDLAGPKAMNRLIQGDVGSGKTIIAVLALLTTANHGYQGAMMAPTEVLAKQHYESITSLFEQYGIQKKVALLTGSMTAKEKKNAYEEIKNHQVDIIVGTHALIQEKVEYHSLALVITDEQHRFGVCQREALSEKGNSGDKVHILVMSATPIPRTLAIILYGDLDISVIDELPANRQPIKNCVVDTGYRSKAYEFIEQEIKKGRQAYIICPMVEESEQMEAENVIDYTQRLKERYTNCIKIAYLHGKMKSKEKNEIMEQFTKNEIQVLVSTTVIEVGVNVPNATVMMVENAERFGLAQLHQLRGRVGRGKEQSYCIFVSSSKKKETMDRLEILNKSNDGFYIASEDLKLRGPGDLLGIRQSGLLQFRIGDIFTDAEILKNASDAAKSILEKDPKMERDENKELKEYLEKFTIPNLENLNL